MHDYTLLAVHIPTRRKSMVRTFMIAVASAAILTLSAAAFAQQGQLGTAQEARTMLDKAVAAVKGGPSRGAGDVQQGRGRL